MFFTIIFSFILNLKRKGCWFKCSYNKEKNKRTIGGFIERIKDVENKYLKANEIIDFVQAVLPIVKSTRSKADAEYRIFVDSSQVQNDPVYTYDGKNSRRQSMPKVTVCSCNAYIELPYGDGLKKILLPERYFNVLDRSKCSNISIEKYVFDLTDE